MLRKLAILAILVFSPSAAIAAAPRTHSKKFDAEISAATLDASSTTADIEVNGEFAKAVVFVAFTYNAATNLIFTPWCSNDAGTTFFRFSSRSITAGTATVTQLVDNIAVSGNLNFFLEYEVKGCDVFRIVLTDTAGGASDSVTADVILIAGD